MTGAALRKLAIAYGVPADELDAVVRDIREADFWFNPEDGPHILVALALWGCRAVVAMRRAKEIP
jgi:hypothetical protein